jgi:hypothetical protein
MRTGRPWLSPRAALAVFVGCGAVALWALHSALELDAAGAIRSVRSRDALVVPAPAAGVSASRLTAAVAKDPFHVARRRPGVRFRLPGEGMQSDGVPATADAGGQVQLIGTAVLPHGHGFAMCQWGAEPARLVRVGERVGELTLRFVGRGRATFVNREGRSMEVRVPKAGT